MYESEFKFYLIVNDFVTEIDEPTGWDDVTINFKRDESYFGINNEFTETALGFDCAAGRKVIDEAYNAGGADAEVFIKIEFKDCGDTNFHEIFFGKLNLYDLIKDSEDNTYKCNIERSTFEDLFNSRIETQVDLGSGTAIDGQVITGYSNSGIESIELHSKTLILQSLLQAENVQHCDTGDHTQGNPAGVNIAVVQKMPIVESGLPTTGHSASAIVVPFWPNSAAGTFLRVNQNRLVTFEWDLKGYARAELLSGSPFDGDDVELFYLITEPDGFTLKTVVQMQLLDGGFQNQVLQQHSIDTQGSVNINMLSGEYLGVAVVWRDIVANDQTASEIRYTTCFDPGSFLKAFSIDTTDPTDANVILTHEALSKITTSITGENDRMRSDYFGRTDSEPRSYMEDGCGSKRAVTSGHAIRQFPLEERPISSSFRELIDSLRAVEAVGFGIERENGNDIIRVESIDHFFQDQQILQFDRVGGYSEETALDFTFNEIFVGYDKWESEGINGLDEVSSKHEYLTPIRSHKNELELISKFMASGYAIELTRRKPKSISNDEDFKYDEERFIICVRRDGPDFVTEKDEDFDIVSNILDPATAYNLRISPKRNLLRWAKFINSFLYYKDGSETVQFRKGEANYQMETQFNQAALCPGGDPDKLLIGENASLTIAQSNQGERLFIPEIINFKTAVSRSQMEILKTNPYGYVSVFNGEEYRQGFILNAGWRATENSCVFKLLRKA